MNISRADHRRRLGTEVWVLAVLVAWLLILAACGSSDDDGSAGDEALAVGEGYIEAFNSGDAGAVLAALTSDVALSEKYTGMSTAFEPIDRESFEQHLAWATAQGATFVSPECALADDSSGAAINVSCEFGWRYAAEKAAGAPPVPTVLALVVTPDGISQLAFEYPPEFTVDSFDQWLHFNHSDDSQGVDFGDWNSVDEARQGGILRAQYVSEWAADLATGVWSLSTITHSHTEGHSHTEDD